MPACSAVTAPRREVEICQAVRTELVAAELADCAGDGCCGRGGDCVVIDPTLWCQRRGGQS
jgi:hypothetical protein